MLAKINPSPPERSEKSRVFRVRAGAYKLEVYCYTANLEVAKSPKAQLRAMWDYQAQSKPETSRFSIPLAVIRVTHDSGVVSERSLTAKVAIGRHGQLYASSFSYTDRRSKRSVTRLTLASTLPVTREMGEQLISKAEEALRREINYRNHRPI